MTSDGTLVASRTARASTAAGIARHTGRSERVTQALSLVAVWAAMCVWHVRTSGRLEWTAWLLLAIVVLMCASYGTAFRRITERIVETPAGMPLTLIAGFFASNTLLFILVVASPFGMAVDFVVVVAVGALCALLAPLDRPQGPSTNDRLRIERCGLACIVVVAVAATLWTTDQQPPTVAFGDQTLFRLWHDVFIHLREISTFADAHGLRTVYDIRMDGAPAPVYHFASYMFPAALNALTHTSALEAYAAFQLPLGILLAGLAAFALAQVLFGSPLAALIAAVVVTTAPDSEQQGFAVRFLSYHFMTQVNLGMFYGVACVAAAWVFMIEACRRARIGGIAIAYVFLAVSLVYKAHVFVANAYLLLIYPAFFFGALRRQTRMLLFLATTLVFLAVVTLSQAVPSVPTLRLDGSGFQYYFEILRVVLEPGPFQWVFYRLFYRPALVSLQLPLQVAYLILATYGFWIVAAAWAWRRAALRPDRFAFAFVGLVTLNYLVMSTLLALDDRGRGLEEFVNRPHAWAYFVLVVGVAGSGGMWVERRWASRKTSTLELLAIVLGGLLVTDAVLSRNLQTLPAHRVEATYIDFNAWPTCQVAAANYIRMNKGRGDVLQDTRLDRRFVSSAIAEQRSFISASTFSGQIPGMQERLDEARRLVASGDVAALRAHAKLHGIHWYLMHPQDAGPWPAAFLQTARFECGGYRVFEMP